MWMTTLYETSRLTLELRDLVDNGDNSVDIWAFDYPSYYEGEEKTKFEQKVIDHFYFRQIGQETVGRFIHCFRTKIREIMPYYIQLYKSQKLMQSIDDPFGNIDITETFEQESTGLNTSESSGTSTSSSSSESQDVRNGSEHKQHKFSNTPQGSINNLDDHLTEAFIDDNTNNDSVESSGSGEVESSSSGNSTENTTGTVKHTLTRKGNQGVNTYAHDMKELRETFLNIDMMIINDLNELFLGVY